MSEEFPYTEAEKAVLEWRDPPSYSDEELYGYDHSELNRSEFSLGDFRRIDGVGPIQSVKEVFERQGSVAILDAGAGTGRQLFGVINYAVGMYGLDWNAVAGDAVSDKDFSGMAEEWKVKAAYMTGMLNYEVADLTELQLPTAAYDIAYSYELLTHIEKPGAIVENMYQSLKPGGVVFFNANGKQRAELLPLLAEYERQGAVVGAASCETSAADEHFAEKLGHELPTRDVYKIQKPL